MDKTQIEYVANLSRLNLTESEKELFLNQLSNIFSHINKLNELDTTDVKPMTNAIELVNIFREDINSYSLSKKQALKNSPAKTDHLFKIPQVLD